MKMAVLQASRTSMLAALAIAAALMASGLGATPASAAVICDSPDLPPGCGEYRTAADVHVLFEDPDLDPDVKKAILSDVSHSSFFNPVITLVPDPTSGPDELEEFDSTLKGLVQVTLSDGTIIPDQPFVLQGLVEVLSQGKAGNTTGIFQTEIISMSLIGVVLGKTVEIRENRDQPSLGQTTITPFGGDFVIDSFFDIFVELSIDGGPFIPQTGGPSRITLVPEPSSVVLAVLGFVGLFAHGRRRRRAKRVGRRGIKIPISNS
ncbi:MAG: PEP-CTERM sorting domain-containing protein [Planctomycetes bacterium]|nr:PEP-CTERM sorting domain-containing protein [Planctomycetota bacterium]